MSHPSKNEGIASPFASVRSSPAARASARKGRSTNLIAGIVVAVVLLAGVGFFAVRFLNDPYRNLEDFPTGKYFESFSALSGLKFRANLRVEADLGWKEGSGRLMVFTPEGEARQLAVFIPPSLSNVFFNKGQSYTMGLEVKEGGLIYADSCRKN